MTFSIVAVDAVSGHCGIAITTSSIAVGSRCPWVRSGVGAVATQNVTDPNLGRIILDRMESGDNAERAIAETVDDANHIQYRQLTAVDRHGNVSHFTGKHILGKHAVATGSGCVAAGNLLANSGIPQAMIDVFMQRDSSRHLAESLLNALQAGLNAGGEEGPVHSAAVLVASEYEWPDVNLRVDWATDCQPVTRLFTIWREYEAQREDYILRAVSPDMAPSYGVPGDL